MMNEAGSKFSASEFGTTQGLTDGGAPPHPRSLYEYSSKLKPFDRFLPRPVHGNNGDDNSPAPCHAAHAAHAAALRSFRRDGLISFSNAFCKETACQLGKSLSSMTDGSNEKFAVDFQRAFVKNGGTPDFTSGEKIPWIQYEAGTSIDLRGVRNGFNQAPRSNDHLDNGVKSTVEYSKYPIPRREIAHRVRKIMGFVGYDPVIDSIVTHRPLLSLVATFLQCNIDDLELFQDMALQKPSFGGREKPWHQDNAFFNIGLENERTQVVGCWLAVDEATVENGCMRMERGAHTKGPMMHFSVRDYQICDVDAPSVIKGSDIVAVPLSPGGLVLFDGMTPHGTPTNNSSDCRRALQFHWVKKGVRMVAPHDQGGRIQLFGGVTNNLTC